MVFEVPDPWIGYHFCPCWHRVPGHPKIGRLHCVIKNSTWVLKCPAKIMKNKFYAWCYRTEIKLTRSRVGRGRVTPRKVGWGCAAHFPKPLPCLWRKSAIFATLFMTWPKIRYPVYDRCGRHSCPKHKLWRAFINGLINNNEKVASSKKHTQFKTRVRKPYPI